MTIITYDTATCERLDLALELWSNGTVATFTEAEQEAALLLADVAAFAASYDSAALGAVEVRA